jgi:hypothetical protein
MKENMTRSRRNGTKIMPRKVGLAVCRSHWRELKLRLFKLRWKKIKSTFTLRTRKVFALRVFALWTSSKFYYAESLGSCSSLIFTESSHFLILNFIKDTLLFSAGRCAKNVMLFDWYSRKLTAVPLKIIFIYQSFYFNHGSDHLGLYIYSLYTLTLIYFDF